MTTTGPRFRFPEVDNAYVPSGSIGLLAVPSMLAMGGVAALLGGYLLGAILPSLDNLSRKPGLLGILLTILEIILKLAAFGFLGAGVGLAVHVGGRFGRNRNQWAALVLGLVCGVIVFIVVVSVGWDNPEYEKPTVAPLMAIAMFVALVLGPAATAYTGVGEDPFCEDHRRFLERREIHKLPYSAEGAAMDLLLSRDFAAIAKLPGTQDMMNYAAIELWFCDVCEAGYLSMTTTLSILKEDDYEAHVSEEERQVFSSSLNASEVKMIIGRER